MTTRRRQRVRIRARGDMTTEETKANPSSNVGNPSYAKARANLPQPSKPPSRTKSPATSKSRSKESAGTKSEAPQPNEQALMAKDLVKVDDILAHPVLTPNEVGTLLRVSPTTVLRLVQDGDIPAMQVRKETRMLRIDVLRYMRDLRSQRERHQQWHDDNPRFGGNEESIT